VRRVSRLVALALVLAATAVAAGCGGDDENPTAAWADDACGAIQDWETTVSDTIASVTDGVPSADDISAAVDQVVQATSSLGDELDGIGPPPTEAQAQTEDALSTLKTSLNERADTVQQAIDAGGSSLSDLASLASTVLEQAQGAVTDAQTFFDATADPGSAAQEVVDAIDQSDTCTAVRDDLSQLTGS
jgi:methyl-accepting chemotaxis protein